MKIITLFFGTILFIIRFTAFFVWYFIMMFKGAYYCYLHKNWYGQKQLSYTTRVWARGEAWIFGIKVKIHGDISRHSGLIVSNHVSYMDIMLLGSIFSLRFAPKDDIRSWPVLGWLIGLSRPVWINRSSKQSSIKVLKEFEETINNRISLIAFPEGTTSSGLTDLIPFKSTTFETAVTSNLPVYPVLIKYQDDAIAWYGEGDPLLIHAWKILSKWHIKADLYVLPPVVPPIGTNRKDFSSMVYGIMNENFKKILKGELK
ncbi:MAG TPA: hypothetical protein DD381_02380 [Lentisphaeria bacterium]|nr:MAG: hypothetical protein A2X47_08655 [Lentisphaerae bacterium GWF2_38_69]HBM15183.1 hypothetical protein [Lentisphaeria bacterium]